MSIRKFCILGERCSGTHFLQNAIQSNFAGLEYDRKTKHFFGHHDDTDYVNADETLYIGIVRDAVCWLDSLYHQPHHVAPSLTKSWKNFLTNSWHSIIDFDETRLGQELMEDRCIGSMEPYRDVFALRRQKCAYLLDVLPTLVPHCMLVCYEDLRDQYGLVLSSMQKRFGLRLYPEVELKGEWRRVLHYKDQIKETFRVREVTMPEEWRDWVYDHVDKEQEMRMGYKGLKTRNL